MVNVVGPRNETVDENSRSGEDHSSGDVPSHDGDAPSHKKRLTLEVTDTDKGSQSTMEEHSAGDARNEHARVASSDDHRSGDGPSHDGDGPSNEDLGGTSGNIERASILSNDTPGLKIKLLERGTPVTISVSSDVTARATVSRVPLKVRDIRVPVFENADKVDNLLPQLHALEQGYPQASSRRNQRVTKPCASNRSFGGD